MKIQEALQWGYNELRHTSESARLESELLLGHILKKPSVYLVTQNNESLDLFRFFPIRWWVYKWLVGIRKKGVPMAYLLGHKEFYRLEFEVGPQVLVPRPDTEFLVEEVIAYLRRSGGVDHPSRFLLIDVGTGSGCIPISVLKNVEGVTAIATDIAPLAIKVAEKNALKHGVADRIQFVQGDLLAGVSADGLQGRELVLTANLPYLPDTMEVAKELTFEPSAALFAGPDGTSLYRRLCEEIKRVKPKAVFLELFKNQVGIVESALPGYRVVECKVLSGEARCLMIERK